MTVISNLVALLTLSAVGTLANPTFPLLARQGNQACRNQSCAIATIAGSTGSSVYPYNYYPTGDNQSGDCCIIRNFPAVKDSIYRARPGLQAYCTSIFGGGDQATDSNPPGVNSVSAPNLPRDLTATTPCKPNILIWAKGTFEPGDAGITIGNSFQQGLGTDRWQVVGVNYDASLDGIYCLGLPGGKIARATFNQVMTTCPKSKIFVGGYSQGAMVVRNAIARIPAAQAARISNVITYGDPFCGAKIGQYNGPINIFCNPDDGVCNGQLDITFGHLNYGAQTQLGIQLLKSQQA